MVPEHLQKHIQQKTVALNKQPIRQTAYIRNLKRAKKTKYEIDAKQHVYKTQASWHARHKTVEVFNFIYLLIYKIR